jgi:hypothetical protein
MQIKSRRMRWAWHTTNRGEGRNLYRVSMGKPEGKSHLEDQDLDGIKTDLREISWRGGVDSSGSG